MPALPDTGALGEAERKALAGLWGEAVRGGAADVAAYAELALVLQALGAPLDLVRRAVACSAEQAGSVAAGLPLAEAYAGRPLLLPAPLALLRRTPGGVRRPGPALRRLAVRALRDGLLVGGHVAQVTCWASATSEEPAVRAALSVVAASEAHATALWGDVLDWALAQRPRSLGRLRRLDLTETSPVVQAVAAAVGRTGAHPAALAAHGWPRVEQVSRLWAVHRAGVLARVGLG